MEFTCTLTNRQERGWQIIVDRINAQRAQSDLPDQTIAEVITEQLANTGDREAIRDTKAKKAMTEINTVEEAVDKLRALGWQLQAPR